MPKAFVQLDETNNTNRLLTLTSWIAYDIILVLRASGHLRAGVYDIIHILHGPGHPGMEAVMKTVNILLSSYNGEKFIAEQIESLLAQDYPAVTIHIRDDGSSDGTVDVIRRFTDRPNVKLYEGENVGYRRSFAWLLSNCRGADYYAYCDQDDHWMPDKISRAVKALDRFDENTPAIYIGDFFWGDADCNPGNPNRNAFKKHSLVKYITTGDMNTFGFTEVFNECAAAGIRDREPLDLCVHDQIVYLYCRCAGKVIWDEKPTACYRRYGENASPQELQGGSRLTHLVWQIRTFLLSSGRDRIYDRFREFYQAYGDIISPEDKKVFSLYINEGHRLKKALYRGVYRDKRTEDLMIRLLFLMGKV